MLSATVWVDGSDKTSKILHFYPTVPGVPKVVPEPTESVVPLSIMSGEFPILIWGRLYSFPRGKFSIIFDGYVPLTPPNPHPDPDQHLVEFWYRKGEGLGYSIIFGGYVSLAPPNPYTDPDQHLADIPTLSQNNRTQLSDLHTLFQIKMPENYTLNKRHIPV